MALLLFLLFVFGFLAGIVAVIAAEAFGALFIINKLKRRAEKDEALVKAAASEQSNLDPLQSLEFLSRKQGYVWILEARPQEEMEKTSREQKKKKELVVVSPVRKYAKVNGRSLIIVESDGSKTSVHLKDWSVYAVSASSLPSKKWAKRFPIKLESNTSAIYNGSKSFYMYLETTWEKESWCKALRLASCNNNERLEWFAKLHEDFHHYLSSFSTGYPSFTKPYGGFFTEPICKENRLEGYSSKLRLFWKKFSRKTSKVGLESKVNSSLSGREEIKPNEKFHAFQDSVSQSTLIKVPPTTKRNKGFVDGNLTLPAVPNLTHSGSESHMSVVSEADCDDKVGCDEGTLCWNLLISRFFFDAKNSEELNRFLHQRIQRALSDMRTPSYVGEVICSKISTGNLPPYINAMRVLPLELNEVWAIEVDLEYSGGFILDIETRLEVRELDSQKSIIDKNLGSTSMRDVSSVLLEDFENIEKQLNSEGAEPGKDGSGNSKPTSLPSSSTSESRWKSVINSIAKQVSQVPISLGIKIAFLRGTLRLHIKPPPSDQLWYGFTSMPEIDFHMESYVGERKITSGHVALLFANRLKAAIRDTLVLPNCESLLIPWMIAEKDDWVPQKIAPLIWRKQEQTDPNIVSETQSLNHDAVKGKTEAAETVAIDQSESKHHKPKSMQPSQQTISECSNASKLSSDDGINMASSDALDEIRVPLLGNVGPVVSFEPKRDDTFTQSPTRSRSITSHGQGDNSPEEDDAKPKRIGRRERMLDLRKKVGEKLEEKRRHFEEKGRNIVDKMRGP